jgi:hypothetical protein
VAQTIGLLSNRTTGTTPAPVFGKCGNENRMHWILYSTRSVRLSGEDLWLCMQNASECQDVVTTRQDHGQTCRDVFANVKPSYVSCRSRHRMSRKRLSAPLPGSGGVRTLPPTHRGPAAAVQQGTTGTSGLAQGIGCDKGQRCIPY